MPTNSASLTNLLPANLKENNNVPPSSANAGGSAAVITQTANCEHCAADHRKRHSKDSLCRRHVQCVHLPGSTEPSNVHHPNNSVGLNSVITTIEGSTTTTTATGTNVSSSLATTTNLNLTGTAIRPAATNQLSDREPSQTSAKKIRPLKRCAEHNMRVRSGYES